MMKSNQQSVSSKQHILKRCKIAFIVFLFAVYCLLPTSSYSYEIRSRAGFVMDAATGKILYAKNPDLKCPPASTTKLMTAIVTIENANLSDTVTISKNASHVAPHKAGFREGDKVTVEKLLCAALIGSANDAAVALAEAVAGSEERFVELMNGKAVAIGAKDTKFINANGLPGPGQYTTASDLAKIMDYALRYPKLKEIIGTKETEISTTRGNMKLIRNTNRLLWSEEDLVGGKTGYTNKARHCFVCAAERKNDMIVVALLGSPSRSDLWKETEMLIGKGFDVMEDRASPAIYLAKTDYDEPAVAKKIHKRGKRSKIKKAKVKNHTKIDAEKAAKQKKTKLYAKKKTKIKTVAKYKGSKKKNYRVAKRGAIDRNKG